MEKNWLTLHADTFLWLKDNSGLVYNTKNKKCYLFPLSDRIEFICCQLLETENLYTTELTNEDLNNAEIIQWVNSLTEIQAGSISYNVNFNKRPVSLKPLVKVQDKKEHYEEQHKRGYKGEILTNLHELTFYINGSEYGNNDYIKQCIFPLKYSQVLDCKMIQSFIKNSRNPFLSNINLVGNIFSYPDFEKFISDISDFSIQCTIHIMAQDFINNFKQIKAISWLEHVKFNFMVDTVIDFSLIRDFSFPFSITTLILSENDYIQYAILFEEISTTHIVKFIPVYNYKNLIFFERNVFMDKDELENIDLSKNEIFMQQKLNIINFGKLTITPDGAIYANVNRPPLGTIYDSPYSIVYKEFIEGESWFDIRDKVPCIDCIYQWLCPSPSNYETVIGRPNLCHIKKC